MATLANLVVQVSGNTLALNRSLDKTQGRISKFSGRAGTAIKALGPPFLIAAGAAAAFGAKSIATFASVGDEIDKMSQRTGFSAEALSELRFAAEQSGADINTLEKGVKRMAAVILDAEQGLKTATDSFDLLNISVKDLQGLSPEEQFDKFARAIAGVEDPTRRAALAQEVFGRAGTALLPLFNQGEAGMRALREEAHELGIVFDQEGAASAARWTDSMNSLGKVFEGIQFIVGAFLVDALQPIIDETIEAVVAIKDWVGENEALVAGLAKAVQVAARLLNPFTAIAKVLPLITDAVNATVEAINFLIRAYNSLPSAFQVFGELKELTFEARDATADMAAAMDDARMSATQMRGGMDDLTDSAEKTTSATDAASESITRLSFRAQLAAGPTGRLADAHAALTKRQEETARAAEEAADALDAADAAGARARATALRQIGGFADAAFIASPPSLFGGLDAIRRGLNADFQRGVIDFDTHQALLRDAGSAFGGTALAAGGIVTRPTTALIGEAGPEAVIPLDRFGGGTTVIVNIGELRAEQDDVDFVVNAIRDAVASGDLDVDELG